MSQAGCCGGGGGGADNDFLTGNVGGPVGQDVNQNTNIIGAGGVLVSGNPATNTLTITVPSNFGALCVQMTSAQVKNLVASPVLLVPAQGAGTAINIISCSAKLTYGGTSPFVAGGGFMTLNYGNVYVLGTNITNNFMDGGSIDQTVNFYNFSTVGDAVDKVPGAQVENAAVYIVNAGGVDYTGNAENNNTVTVCVAYNVLII